MCYKIYLYVLKVSISEYSDKILITHSYTSFNRKVFNKSIEKS